MSELKLYQHNQEVYDGIIENLKTKSKVAIVQATGTGKGVVASKLISEAYKDKNIVIVAPTNTILVNYIENLNITSNRVQLITYAKLLKFTKEDLCKLARQTEVLFLDEFHRTGAEKWGNAVEFLVAELEKLDKKTIGLSATPVRYLDNERNMADELFDGNIILGVDLEEAIEKGILPTFKYVISLYGYEKEIEKIEKKVQNVKDQKVLDKLKKPIGRLQLLKKENEVIKKIVVDETKELGNNQKWIVFCNDTVELQKMKKIVIQWFDKPVNTYYISSDYSKSETNETLRLFNELTEGINILLCVNMLNEGVHIKDISGVFMLRKTMSPIIFMQQLGRALTAGIETTPIIFDFIGNYRNLSKYKEFGFNIIESIAGNLKSTFKNANQNNKIIINNYVEDIKNIFDILNELVNNSRPWTQEEDDIIRQYYSLEGGLVCNRLEGRTKSSCITRAHRLNVIMRSTAVAWSLEEDEILLKYYSEEGAKAVSTRLEGRTIISCNYRAKFLGLCSARYWTKEEDKVLKKYYPVEGPEVFKRLKNRNKTSCINRALALKINPKVNSWTEEEDNLIRKYYPVEGYATCKRLNDRTEASCATRARKLGVKKKNLGKTWTKEEDAILYKYYPLEGGSVYKRLIDRTAAVCTSRASKLKLHIIRN